MGEGRCMRGLYFGMFLEISRGRGLSLLFFWVDTSDSECFFLFFSSCLASQLSFFRGYVEYNTAASGYNEPFCGESLARYS